MFGIDVKSKRGNFTVEMEYCSPFTLQSLISISVDCSVINCNV